LLLLVLLLLLLPSPPSSFILLAEEEDDDDMDCCFGMVLVLVLVLVLRVGQAASPWCSFRCTPSVPCGRSRRKRALRDDPGDERNEVGEGVRREWRDHVYEQFYLLALSGVSQDARGNTFFWWTWWWVGKEGPVGMGERTWVVGPPFWRARTSHPSKAGKQQKRQAKTNLD